MSKNSAAHHTKVEHAVLKLLNRWTGGVAVTRDDATTSRMRDGNWGSDGNGRLNGSTAIESTTAIDSTSVMDAGRQWTVDDAAAIDGNRRLNREDSNGRDGDSAGMDGGWCPTQAQVALPMVWGWHLRARLGRCHAPDDDICQSRWPPRLLRTQI